MALEDMTVEVQELLPAPPEQVWALLTDVERMAGLGPEHTAARWHDERRGLGAVFFGANDRWGRQWEVPCVVVAWDPPTRFGWRIGHADAPTATWSYALVRADGGTLVTQRFAHGPGRSLLRAAVGRDPDREDELVAERGADLAANMRTVLRAAGQLLA